MRVTKAVMMLTVCAVAVGGCGGGPTGPEPTAVMQMTASPSPITPVSCPPSSCGPLTGQSEVTATLTVRETAGVAGVVTRVGLVLRRQSDNAIVAQGEAPSAAGTRFAGRGSFTVPIAMHYDRTLGEANMKVVVTLEARDDNGHTITTVMEIQVLSAP